jgi:hypothetical protein
MAKGKIKAHSNSRLPGNSQVATNHAVMMPMLATPTVTPKAKTKVVHAYPGNTVFIRCQSTSPLLDWGFRSAAKIPNIGKANTKDRSMGVIRGRKMG